MPAQLSTRLTGKIGLTLSLYVYGHIFVFIWFKKCFYLTTIRKVDHEAYIGNPSIELLETIEYFSLTVLKRFYFLRIAVEICLMIVLTMICYILLLSMDVYPKIARLGA